MEHNPVGVLIKSLAAVIIYKSFFHSNRTRPRNGGGASLNYILNGKVIKIIAPRVLKRFYNFGTLPSRILDFSAEGRD